MAESSVEPVEDRCSRCGRTPAEVAADGHAGQITAGQITAGQITAGQITAGQGIPLTWSAATEPDGTRTLLCDACVREHVRSIEGKLDHEWW